MGVWFPTGDNNDDADNNNNNNNNSFSHGSLSSTKFSAIPSPPATDPDTPQSPSSDQESDASQSTSTTTPKSSAGVYRCEYPGCKSKQKVFTQKGLLRKHQHNHTRPRKCPYCTAFRGGAERKDLARHMRRAHADRPDVRADRTLWREVNRRCERCGASGMRADNLKRHLKRCRRRPSEAGAAQVPVQVQVQAQVQAQVGFGLA
ncbi:de66275d-7bf2-4842-a961-336f8ee8b53d [Thermothielavioides terrestris]|uniref:De66275d-7bf2-4842-a961-336f8ee8b53d n=1 Tax=Thermothielavioides terrestris TaxID=2587410 RepID=A0A446BS99_9PEZI|nr:de66275d-7bf2-4842-a961-336f8ee8b53d [Thermothielavioides terrestris]